MEKIPKTVFHGTHEKFDSEEAKPKRQVRTRTNESGVEEVIFDEESFHATLHRWVALAYTEKSKPIEGYDFKAEYAMAVSLYEDNKKLAIIGVESLEHSLEVLYGEGGYVYHFEEDKFIHKEGLGELEIITHDPALPIEVERVDDPVAQMKDLGVSFEFIDVSLPENAHFRDSED